MGAGVDDGGGGLGVYAPIDFEFNFVAPFVDDGPEAADLIEDLGDEGLSTKAGIDGEDEDYVEEGEGFFDGGDGGGRVEGHTGAAAAGLDLLENAVEVVHASA